MEDSRNGYDSVRSIDEGYIGEVGSILIARALIFLLEAPFSYLSCLRRGLPLISGENNHRLPLLSSQEKTTSHLRSGLNLISSQEVTSSQEREITSHLR